MPTPVASGLVNEVRQRSRGDATLLSPREAEVSTFIAEGLSVPDIAKRLHLAPPPYARTSSTSMKTRSLRPGRCLVE
ncbi:hypothetical protein ACXDF8_10790 [Mycolicibacterium sp. CBM1]